MQQAIRDFLRRNIIDPVLETASGLMHQGEPVTKDEAADLEKQRIDQGKAALVELRDMFVKGVEEELSHLFTTEALALVTKATAAAKKTAAPKPPAPPPAPPAAPTTATTTDIPPTDPAPAQ